MDTLQCGACAALVFVEVQVENEQNGPLQEACV